MVEHAAVNRGVTGSSPVAGAILSQTATMASLEIRDLAPLGDGVHRAGRERIYVDRALPGDVVEARPAATECQAEHLAGLRIPARGHAQARELRSIQEA